MNRWCNWLLVVWLFVVILLLSSLWFIWNNSFCQIPARYNSTASNIRDLPITPGLLYIIHTTLCQQSSQLLVISLFSISNMLSWILRIILYCIPPLWSEIHFHVDLHYLVHHIYLHQLGFDAEPDWLYFTILHVSSRSACLWIFVS